MRHAVLSMSLLLAICGNVALTQADEQGEYQAAAGYSAPAEGNWVSSAFEDDYDVVDPRYDWDLSRGAPPDINEFFAPPEYGTYLQADVLFLARAHSPNQTVAVTLPPASQTILTADDASLTGNLQPGLMMTYGVRFDQVSALELTFFGFNTWSGSAVANDGGQLSLPGTLPLITQDYIFADRIKIDAESSIYNVEANYTQTISGLKLLAGFRYLRLNDAFDINSTVDALNSSSDYNVWAKNNLIGGQIGMGFDWKWDRLTFDVIGKFGVYGNVAEQNTLLRDLNNTFIRRNFQDHTTVTSVIGEVGLNASYQVLDWLAIRAGYRFMWINNVALAPDQLNFSSAPGAGSTATASNHIFLNGVSVGLEARW